MIIRIVKMEFKKESIGIFLSKFEEVKSKIRQFDGCEHLKLWQDIHNPEVVFTYSYWKSQEHLDIYRHSSLFLDTWSFSKKIFARKAQAWSVTEL